MKNIMSILAVLFVLLSASLAHASRTVEVTVYCQAPTASCDAAMSHLEALNIDFRVVRAWDDSFAITELQMVANQFGVRLTSDAPVIRINDSVVVGISHFDEVYRLIRGNHP